MLGAVYSRWLALTALSYAVVHHLGLLPGGLGDGPDGTRWADWLDLLVPWAVLLPAAATLRADGCPPRTWAVFLVGAGLYFSGHGIHLAGNSVGNAARSPTAHLWDERVGHLVWYAGAALVLVALARSMVGRARPGVVGYVLAVAVGLTWASNALGGGTLWFSLAAAVAACWFGWRHRRDLPVVLLAGFLPAVGVLLVAAAG